jgi:dTDP-glucose 4,6-dehydratase
MNAAKLRSELGWHPEVDFETGLRRTVQWYLDHSQWIHAIETQEYRQWLTTNYGSRLTS